MVTELMLIFCNGYVLFSVNVSINNNAFLGSWSKVRYQISSWQEAETVYLLLWHRKL